MTYDELDFDGLQHMSPLRTYGEHGYEWTFIAEADEYTHTLGTDYRTNGDGQGLWAWSTTTAGHYEPCEHGDTCENTRHWIPEMEWKQIVGTSQFDAGPTRASAYRAIRRYLSTWDVVVVRRQIPADAVVRDGAIVSAAAS